MPGPRRTAAQQHVRAQRVDDDQAELSRRGHGWSVTAEEGGLTERAQPLVLAPGAALAGGASHRSARRTSPNGSQTNAVITASTSAVAATISPMDEAPFTRAWARDHRAHDPVATQPRGSPPAGRRRWRGGHGSTSRWRTGRACDGSGDRERHADRIAAPGGAGEGPAAIESPTPWQMRGRGSSAAKSCASTVRRPWQPALSTSTRAGAAVTPGGPDALDLVPRRTPTITTTTLTRAFTGGRMQSQKRPPDAPVVGVLPAHFTDVPEPPDRPSGHAGHGAYSQAGARADGAQPRALRRPVRTSARR